MNHFMALFSQDLKYRVSRPLFQNKHFFITSKFFRASSGYFILLFFKYRCILGDRFKRATVGTLQTMRLTVQFK